MEYQRDIIKIRNPSYWTGEHYKDNPNFEPIIEFNITTARAMPKSELRALVKESLKQIKNKDIINKNNGFVARLSSVGIAKMSSGKAIAKSLDNGFSREEHFKAVLDIKNLFEKSIFLRSEKAKNASNEIVAVHRFINDEALENTARALITLKESIQNGNRIYSLELEELKPTSTHKS